MRKTAKYIIVSIAFVLMLAVPIMCISWTGSDYSVSEKRILAAKPTLFTQDGELNLNFGGEFKNWLQDHIGFRSEFVTSSAAIKLRVFGMSPSEQVHIGKDGWYFYTPDDNLKIATGDYPLSEDTLAKILQEHLAIRDKLKVQGIEYVVILPTSKVSIYPEFLRYGDGETRKTPVDIVADYLEENSDLHIVRLKEALLAEKGHNQVYFKTDTHWNQRGAHIAYCEIINNMSRWGLCDTPLAEVRFEDGEYTGEFGAMMGVSLPPEKTENSIVLDQSAAKDADTEQHIAFKETLAAEGIANPCYYYQNKNVNGPRVMMYGDSMFGSWNATELLAENFSEFSYIWDRNIRDSLLQKMRPDIVIYELTERYLNVLPDQNVSFLEQPLRDYSAEILDCEIRNNKLFAAVKNTSNSPWNWLDRVRLGIFSDGGDTGLRADLEANVSVQPGASVEFYMSLESYPDLLNDTLEIQMLQEGLCYFGEKQRVDIKVSS